jgi:hypothetical protein
MVRPFRSTWLPLAILVWAFENPANHLTLQLLRLLRLGPRRRRPVRKTSIRGSVQGIMRANSFETRSKLPARSLTGLNAANFFQAEMVGVILPVLNAFLREAHWRYDAIGVTAVAGLGTLLFQTPAGWLTDKLSCRRIVFVIMASITGGCFVVIPLLPSTYSLD